MTNANANATNKTNRRLRPGTQVVSTEDGEPGRINGVCTFRRNEIDAWSYMVQTAAGREVWDASALFLPAQA